MITLIKTALVAAFVLIPIEAAQNIPPKPPAATKPVTAEQYLAQVDKSNAALDKFLKLPCDDKGVSDAAQDLITQLGNLKTAYAGLSSTEDVLVRDREAELYIGFVDFANSQIQDKSDSCPAPDDDKSPPDDSSDSSYTTS